MSTNESRPKPDPVSDEAQSLHCLPRISSLFMVGAPVVAAAAVAGVVILAALTSWWVLFALFALPPLMMMVCGPVMMTAMRSSSRVIAVPVALFRPWFEHDSLER